MGAHEKSTFASGISGLRNVIVMKTIQNILFLLALLISAISCSDREDKFFDLDKAYSAELKINLEKLRNKIDDATDTNKTPPDTLPEDYAKSRLDKIIAELGFVDSYDNGERIASSECQLIRTETYKNIANSIIIDDCQENSSTDFCKEKWNTYTSLNSIDPEFDHFAIFASTDELMGLYEKKYINKEELDFLILNMYLLVSINTIE